MPNCWMIYLNKMPFSEPYGTHEEGMAKTRLLNKKHRGKKNPITGELMQFNLVRRTFPLIANKE